MYDYQYLQQFTEQIFLALGCPPADAVLAAKVLISADLRGIDSHGIARLPGYVRLADLGRLNPRPKPVIVHQTPSTAVLDGDAGLGLIVAPMAMATAIEKARLSGTAWVAVRNSNHFGIAGYHAALALEQDMIGLAMTHAAPLVAPTFSRDRLLGTNPIAVAIPALEEPPFIMDMATTTAAYGKLELMQRQQKPIPSGWAQDAEGNPTQDAHAVRNGGALLPLGGDREHGSHKGYALGAWVDIFSGILSGANYGPWVPPFATAGFMPSSASQPGMGTGHFLGAIRIDAFRPAMEFKQHMDKWIRTFRQAQPVAGEERVLIPGDPERLLEAQRRKNGIPLNPQVYQNLQELGERWSISLEKK
jgi:L-2-hydroxycarboxylate dehydrogenase (NAD+)